MDNKTFREEVYKKYNYYKDVKKDNFYSQHQYRRNNNLLVLNRVACLLVVCILMTGMVYATTYYIKNIWKEPEEYIYEEEKKVTEEDKKEAITEDVAKDIGINKLREMNMKIGNIKNSYLNKEPSSNKIEWVIETDNNMEIRINAKTGELYNLSDNKLLNSNYSSKVTQDKAIEIANEIYKKLEYKKNYEFSNISNIGSGKWQADFSIKYNEVFNPYQCVRITFIPETKELAMINVFDYEFENNPFEITEDRAIEIAKGKYGEEKIREISASKDIQMMNTIMYQKERPSETGEYRTENIVRNVWNVKITEKQYGFVEKYFIDATTGEIIGGDQVK